MSDPARDVRPTAAFLFTVPREVSGAAEDPIIDLLDDGDELVRQSAAYALIAGLEDVSSDKRVWTTNLLPVLLGWSD